MTDDPAVDKSKFDLLLKKMLETKPLPLADLKGEPGKLAARKPTKRREKGSRR